MTDLQRELPPGTPKHLRRAYARLFFAAAVLGLVAYILIQIPIIGGGLYTICRGTYLCGPAALGELRPLASGYAKGNTVARASQAQFEKYSRQNPDWEICLKDTRSLSRHDVLNVNYEYRMEGTFYAVPKWRGVFERLGDWLAGKTYEPPICRKG